MGTDLTTVNAARVSYGAESKELTDRDLGLVDFLAEHGHVTPFRHATVQLRCKAPIFLARQLGKHQVGFSWNEISRRYKDNEAIPIEFYIPDEVLCRPEKLMKQTAVTMAQDAATPHTPVPLVTAVSTAVTADASTADATVTVDKLFTFANSAASD